ASNWALLMKSRRTGSCRSRFQSSFTAPGMWAASYAVVSSSTSTKTMPAAPRFFSAQSADTSALSRLMRSPLLKVGVQAERAEQHTQSRRGRGGGAGAGGAAVRTPRSEAGTQAGGHAAQVDRAPLSEQGAHTGDVTSRPRWSPRSRPDPGTAPHLDHEV